MVASPYPCLVASPYPCPADARDKPGSGGQLIAFVPSLDLVVTRQTGSSGQWPFEEYLRRACRAVLPDSVTKRASAPAPTRPAEASRH
jgi:hypothetical protein